ncbi:MULTISPECIES: coniferyl aldehyde dehydrogenase [unclassified Ensifer]|uniref:coniferyl aldehyde dehydrogenase n=1 Tax=unclassified Ensifer TaxID=2633371 RepID=UPI0008132B4C|nr:MULTISPECIES: coniferyl aldehyde dehydrogenase [unclassified Ensifer]OCO98813.1 aldehyde dehydrogenase [Ensifer sp. LC14]OCP13292.1 aldehyde dehydrogenase [Ensifer sp. LC13]OCP13893.1 aldehyde dehydrogenase [Ensifer sp. LC11]OCP28274.1 aldehyde dehydrogenase [Ensifer sp. LC499]
MTADSSVQLREIFDRLRGAWCEHRPPVEQRRDDLSRLRDRLRARKDEMCKAIDADFSHRARHETLLGEGGVVLSEIDHTLAKLKQWARPERRKAGWKLWPAKADVRFVPLGLVGIISPWNYPVNLALAPLVAAIAAGNHVFLKPSEHTPRTAEFLQSLLSEVFPQTRVAVALGAAELSAVFAALPFDHLFFTGSTAVGRKVMAAAAENLTPVTLELGGKSPAVVGETADLSRAAARIATGKLFNAGQTCIAPDYVLIHESKRDAFIGAIKREVGGRYPVKRALEDYTSIINARQHDRLKRLLADAEARGHPVIPLIDGPPDAQSRQRLMSPTLVIDPDRDSAVMAEEIFGPILPVISYASTDEAIAYVLAHDRPLALYCFSRSDAEIDAVLSRVVAGGVCINDTLYQFGCNDLPFGGVGASGTGHYHGRDGFLTFSKAMPVLRKYDPAPSDLVKPPYRGIADWVIRFLSR